eukprot:jgi/Hompol1/1584/HPOL_004586-RA
MASTAIDYYDVLGVRRTANDEEIRQAYIRESLKFHPDRNLSEDALPRFQQIATAYYTLSDKDRRNSYNASLVANGGFSSDPVDAFSIFGDTFNDLLVPEVPNPSYVWQPIGTLAGVALGFIVLNIPGAIMGGYLGNRAGKIRDIKGVSVYEAFCNLPQHKRGEILTSLATKLFSTAIAS